MSNNNEEVDDVIEDPIVSDLKEGDEGYDKVDWKDIAEKNRGIAQRNKTRAEKAKAEFAKNNKPPEQKNEKPEGGLDRIDKAILRAEKITDSEEVALVQSIMKETGKDLESVLESKYFQAELKEMREDVATKNATPDGTKRSNTATKDTVDYWIAKGELPADPALRIKVVNAKIAKEKSGSQFSANPIQ